MRRWFLRAGLWLLILLAAGSWAGRIMASQVGQGKLESAHRLLPVYAVTSRPAAHSPHPMAADDVTHFSAGRQTTEVLPNSLFLLTSTLLAIPMFAKDLLGLTQRRRE